MSDQAEGLRQLALATRATSRGATTTLLEPDAVSSRDQPSFGAEQLGTRSMLFTSGKGGVGTSSIVLNLAMALSELGQKVLVVDADLGLANLDLLCGLAPRYDLGDVLGGRCTLTEAIHNGPGGIMIVPGAHALRTKCQTLSGGSARVADQLKELESGADFILVDAGSGLKPGLKMLASAADEVVVVTTPEPTSLADAHAVIGRFKRMAAQPRLRIIVNQAGSEREAAEIVDRLVVSSRQFLGAVIRPLGPGSVRHDARVSVAVRNREPFISVFPAILPSRSLRRIAKAIVQEFRPHTQTGRGGFFSDMAARWGLALTHGD
jgi:flagellar biosynthesis protein FlhG